MPKTEAIAFSSDDHVERILERLTGGLRSILRDQLVGLYLYGSLVTGDFDSGVSDVDLAVVMTASLDPLQFDALHRLHESVVARHPDWHDRLELAYISRPALRSFRQRKSKIGIISPGEPFHLLEAGPDWLISWRALREDGIALLGPPIASLIDPITLDEYLDAVGEHICQYRESVKKPQNKPALSYIVLTVARGLYTLAHRQPASKARAARWAQRRYPRWAGLIERAIAWRANPACDDLTAEQIRPEVAAYVHDMLEGLSPHET